MSLLDRPLLIVSGKGGVGKTSVAAAIGLAAAKRGRRTLIVEVASQREIPALFGLPDTEEGETPLVPGLASISIDPSKALEEYLTLQLRVRAVAERLVESRAFGAVTAAAPGLRELVTLGKVWHLTRQQSRDGSPRYETIVVDAPATGQALALLEAPSRFSGIARVGRIHDESRQIAELITDRDRTAIVLVSLGEEMPVTETIEASRRLADRDLACELVALNGMYPQVMQEWEVEVLDRQAVNGAAGRAAIAAALSAQRRHLDQLAEGARLREGVSSPVVELPMLFEETLGLLPLSVLAEAVDRGFGDVHE